MSQPDPGLLELFRQEATTHSEALDHGLIDWEKDMGNLGLIEPLMRAAHSLKGAARIIGLATYSDLAHELEDCFVAAQKGDIVINTSQFDIFLKIIDLLASPAKLSNEELLKWPGINMDEVDAARRELKSVLSSEVPKEEAVPEKKEETKEAPVVAEKKAVKDLSQKTAEVILDDDVKASMMNVFKNEVQSQALRIIEYIKKSKEQPGRPLDYAFLATAALAIKSTCNLVQKKEAESIGINWEKMFSTHLKEKTEITEDEKTQIIQEADKLIALASSNPVEAQVSEKVEEKEEKVVEEEVVEEKSEEQKPAPKEEVIEIKEEKVEEPAVMPQAPVKATKPTDNAVVKVSATNLSRLMSLAAESLVETQRLAPLKHAILQSKAIFEQLQQSIKAFSKISDPHLLKTALDSYKPIAQEINQNFLNNIQEQLNVFEDFSKNNNLLSSKLYNEVLASRMRPFKECSKSYPRLVRDLSRSLNKKINLKIIGETTPVDRDILEKLDAPLNHLLRNACDHGIESPEDRSKNNKDAEGTISLEARHASGMLLLSITDDGNGIDIEKLRQKIVDKKLITEEMSTTLNNDEVLDFLFLPGFSTAKEVSDISGRGVGLDVVRSMMQEIGGNVRVESSLGEGTKFHLHLPITRSVIRAITVDINGEPYAFPLSRILHTTRVSKQDTETLEGRSYFHHEGQNIAIICANQALGFSQARVESPDIVPVVIIGNAEESYSLKVNKILGETELVVRPMDSRLGKVPCISAASITKEGTPILIADVDDILRSIEKLLAGGALQEAFSSSLSNKILTKRILVVDDSPTVRETQKQLIEAAGYIVETASDGMDGWNTLRSKHFDLVITDIDMPRMNGFEFLKHIKDDAKLKQTPVIVVSYKDREEDRATGLTLGADVYLTKSSFRDNTFVNEIQNLIGNAE